MALPYGLKWEKKGWFKTPEWAVYPDMDAMERIARHHLSIARGGKCEVTFLVEGGRNRSYTVSTDAGSYVLRVALPLDPRKVESEVATMEFVRSETKIPVPAVIAYDTTAENELRFPWILMELMPGKSLHLSWMKKPMWGKKKIIAQLAMHQAQLWRRRLSTIGSLEPPSPDTPAQPTIGRFTDDHFTVDGWVSDEVLGPHRTSTDWLRSRLEDYLPQIRATYERTVADPEGEEVEIKLYAGQTKETEQLLDFLTKIYASGDEPEETILSHSDLHIQNILIDDEDNITAILDWEFQAAVPAWQAAQLPQLIMSEKRLEEPMRADYGSAESFLDPEWLEACDGVSQMYWEAVEAWEATQLRTVYIAEMDRWAPGWEATYMTTKLHRLIESVMSKREIGWPAHSLAEILEKYQGGGMIPKGALQAPEDELCIIEYLSRDTASNCGYEDEDDESDGDSEEEEIVGEGTSEE